MNIIWIFIIIVSAFTQWLIIEVKERRPNHLLWFIVRCIAFGVCLWWYLSHGYMWYWSSFYMVMTFAWLFPLLLNIFRRKPLGYMSAKGSVFDKIIIKTIGPGLYFWFGLVLMIMAIGLQLAYGTIKFVDI